MPPRQPWSPDSDSSGENYQMFPNSTPPGLPIPAPHLPPPAPRLRSIPLPDAAVARRRPRARPTHQDVFPIDLTNDVDFDLLAGRIQNCSIPPHTTIDILPTSRECILLQMTTGDRPTSTFAIIRRLQTIMRAPLSLQVFTTELPPAARQSVRSYFLARSGQDGVGLWQGFLNGARHPQGPRGAVLLRGHCFMWGFSQDHQGQWGVHVGVPLIPGL
ncbi:hypothetical protein FB451DRAFT_1367276 [Mycena latifolia]|nr:hypothetical protein FB451DRAFT_1367276 [Mycena latifolia]